jgi:hypothetical protein
MKMNPHVWGFIFIKNTFQTDPLVYSNLTLKIDAIFLQRLSQLRIR